MTEREEPGAPGRAELLAALAAIEDALGTGLSLHRPGAGTLEALRAADREREGGPTGPDASCSPATGAESVGSGPSGPSPSGLSPAEALASLEARALACSACRLAATRTKVVFGEGVLKPVVLVVGEGPGAEEDLQGLPFVGASGKLLDRMLAAIGLSRRENCYIANIVKCRPPDNREPQPDERACCLPYLREQLAILKPRAILCAGRTAAQALLQTGEGINRLRLRSHRLDGIPLIASYHPSALLRDESLKRPAWEDLKALRDLISGAAESP